MRRWLDPKNISKTSSQEVFGRLGHGEFHSYSISCLGVWFSKYRAPPPPTNTKLVQGQYTQIDERCHIYTLEVQVDQTKWLVFRMIHGARIPDPTKGQAVGRLGLPGYIWVFPKIGVGPPNQSILIGVFHYKPSILGCLPPLFLVQHPYLFVCAPASHLLDGHLHLVNLVLSSLVVGQIGIKTSLKPTHC